MSVHVSGIIQYLLFCTSFHIHLVASIGISFLYMDEYYSTLWTDHTWFIYSSLGCFHLLAIVNNAAKSRGVQVSLRVPAVSSSRYISRSEMATHPSVLVWRIPGMGEPGGLPSLGLHRVGHDWVTSLPLFTFVHWRRKWQPTPVFLSGESQGRGSLMGCRLWGRTESDTTEVT